MDSDPAIRWQAVRDLTDASAQVIAQERARVAREGVGAAILAQQENDGSWRRPDAPVWLPTLFTFLLLRATGVERVFKHQEKVFGAFDRVGFPFELNPAFPGSGLDTELMFDGLEIARIVIVKLLG